MEQTLPTAPQVPTVLRAMGLWRMLINVLMGLGMITRASEVVIGGYREKELVVFEDEQGDGCTIDLAFCWRGLL